MPYMSSPSSRLRLAQLPRKHDPPGTNGLAGMTPGPNGMSTSSGKVPKRPFSVSLFAWLFLATIGLYPAVLWTGHPAASDDVPLMSWLVVGGMAAIQFAVLWCLWRGDWLKRT